MRIVAGIAAALARLRRSVRVTFHCSDLPAALAVRRFFHFDTVIPCHYATFDMLGGKPEDFVAALDGAKTKVLVPKAGEAVTM